MYHEELYFNTSELAIFSSEITLIELVSLEFKDHCLKAGDWLCTIHSDTERVHLP